MKKQLLFVILFLSILSCANKSKEDVLELKTIKEAELIDSPIGFVFNKPPNPQGLVIIFPKFGNSIERTDTETEIDEESYKRGFATLILDYSKSFILKEKDFNFIYKIINQTVKNNGIPEDKIIIGGFSIGGTIALSYSIWINKQKRQLKPKKVFVGDSPVDLLALYKKKEEFIKRKNNTYSLDEAKYIINFLNYYIGDPKDSMQNYLKFSPYIKDDIKNSNIKYLKNLSIRFYSEPDLKWYKEVLGYEYGDTNSYQMELFAEELKKINSNNVDYIKTKDKGFIKGVKNPHSWSIIDKKEFFEWVLKE